MAPSSARLTRAPSRSRWSSSRSSAPTPWPTASWTWKARPRRRSAPVPVRARSSSASTRATSPARATRSGSASAPASCTASPPPPASGSTPDGRRTNEGGTADAVPPSLVLRPSGVEPLAGGGGEAVQLAGADADPDRVALAGDVARVDADDDLALTGTGADVPLGRRGQVQLAVGQGVGAELLDEDHLDRDGALVSLADEGAIPIKVVLIEELGADALAYGELDLEGEAKKEISSGAGEGEIIVRVDPRNVPRKGDTVWVGIRTGELHCFSASTGERLNP